MNVILSSKAFRIKIIFVFIQTTDKIVGHTNIQANICIICEHVNKHATNSPPVIASQCSHWRGNPFLFSQMSRFTTYFAFCSIHSRLGSTSSPIRMVKT